MHDFGDAAVFPVRHVREERAAAGGVSGPSDPEQIHPAEGAHLPDQQSLFRPGAAIPTGTGGEADCREKAEKPAKRKLTRNQRKQIEAVIRQAKGDGKNHTVQDSIPFQNMFPDGLCRLEGGTFSKTIAFEDVNYRLAGPEDQRSIFESLCDFYNGYDPTIGVQVTLDSRSGGSAADEMFGITRQGNDRTPSGTRRWTSCGCSTSGATTAM